MPPKPKPGSLKIVKPTADSTKIYVNKYYKDIINSNKSLNENGFFNKKTKDLLNIQDRTLESIKRQANKGKPGYDQNGFPIKKSKLGGPVLKGSAHKKTTKKK